MAEIEPQEDAEVERNYYVITVNFKLFAFKLIIGIYFALAS